MKRFSNRLRIWMGKSSRYKALSLGVHLRRLLIATVAMTLRPIFRLFDSSYLGRQIYFECQSSNKLLLAKTDKLDFFVNSSDKIIGRSTYCSRVPFDTEKLFATFELIKNLRGDKHNKVELLIDIGANIGTIGLTAVASKIVNSCLAFEPEPRNYKLLQLNIAVNNLSKIVCAHNLALSDGRHTEIEFELDDRNYGDHRVRVTNSPGLFGESARQIIKVATARLDDFTDQINPTKSLIWMDTQGFEGYVLSGAKNLLASGIPIVTEFWPYGLKRSGCFDLLLDALDSGKYTQFTRLDGDCSTRALSRKNIRDLAEKLGWDGDFTDILIC